MNQQEIILIGGGGHCRACIDVIETEGRFSIAGIVDVTENTGKKILGYQVIATDSQLEALSKKYTHFLITLGQIKSGKRRKELFDKLKELGVNLPVIISPHAYVSKHARVAEGSIVMHGAIVNAGACIGKNNILNSKCLIEHDAETGDHCHISTGAIINGEGKTGQLCFIGSHATLAQTVTIGDNSIVGAGSLVLQNLEGNGIFAGIPALKVK